MPAKQNIYLWDKANNAWEEAPASVVTKRMVAVGQVVTGKHKLYWMNMNPSVASSVTELTDDLDGLGAVVLDHFDTARDGHTLDYSPPMQFATGIYPKTFTNLTSITFGYI